MRNRSSGKRNRDWDRSRRGDSYTVNPDFRCAHCDTWVTANRLVSGVVNRNHCPYCLWSVHLDSREAGDRLSACKGPMQPVALSLKRIVKKYARPDSGELMVVHRCTACAKTSLNRIAADDDVGTLLEVFADSADLEPALRENLEAQGIRVLGEVDRDLVKERLLGKI